MRMSPFSPRRSADRAIARFGLPLALALAVGGCVLPTTEPQNQTDRYPTFGLEEFQPADIAVVPIQDRTEGGLVPVRTLRRELYRGLTERLYSPLSLDYVDVNWVEAGFDSSTLEAGGVLQVTVEEWDTSLLQTHGALRVVVQAEILDGTRPGADPLWGARVKRRLELDQGEVTLSREELFDKAARETAREILELIPVRDPAAR